MERDLAFGSEGGRAKDTAHILIARREPGPSPERCESRAATSHRTRDCQFHHDFLPRAEAGPQRWSRALDDLEVARADVSSFAEADDRFICWKAEATEKHNRDLKWLPQS